MAKKKTELISFEDAISELENLVESMEQGDISLQESLAAFERGIELTRNCQNTLLAAEQKIQKLTKSGKLEALEPSQGET
ncbi:MAG: exodeoxyribonuclease VII small subunit [Thiohalomonadales bacterium]